MSAWKTGTDDLGEKSEHRLFFETSPCITRAALAQQLFDDPVFAALDFAVDFGTCTYEIIPNKDKLKSDIEFVITVWDVRDLEEIYWLTQPALSAVNQALVVKYGPCIAGEQLPAMPHWH